MKKKERFERLLELIKISDNLKPSAGKTYHAYLSEQELSDLDEMVYLGFLKEKPDVIVQEGR